MSKFEEMELKTSKLLRVGVLLSGLLMMVGWLMFSNFNVNPLFNFKTYDHIPLNDVIKFHIFKKDWGVLISYAGLALLIILPLVRVFLTAILFLRQKEFLLAGIAFIVLFGLFLSMLLGFEL